MSVRPQLEIVAEPPRQWTGVAVAPAGRLFVNAPRWSDDVPIHLGDDERDPFRMWRFKP